MSTTRTEPCGRCGTVAPVKRRTDEGTALCRNCWNRDPASWKLCAACGERRRINARTDAGESICTRCYRQVWPRQLCDGCDEQRRIYSRRGGAWCENCYRHVRPRRPCGGCGRTRPVNKRGRDGEPDLCAACNWAPTVRCSVCGVEAMCRRSGGTGSPVCLRCTAMTRIDELLAGPDGHIASVFDGLRAAFAAASQPRSLHTWLDRSPGAALLAQLADGSLGLDHASLDQLDQTASVHHLRQLLVACSALPERDPQIALVERAIDRHGRSLSTSSRRVFQTYATWQHLARLRRRYPDGDTPPLATSGVQTRLAETARFLVHLDRSGIALSGLTQANIDRWIANRASARRHIRGFIIYTDRHGHTPPGLEVAVHDTPSTTTPLESDRRWVLARRLLHDDTLDPADRVVGTLVLLYAQPVARIARLTLNDVHDHGDHLTITFGKDHLELPDPLAGLLRQLPWRRQTGPSGTVADADRWLFPGRQAGQHLHPSHLSRRLTALGIQARAARHAALLQLAREVPAAVLADTLGINVTTATRWAARSGATWSNYAATRVNNTP